MTLPDSVYVFISGLVICWLTGYGAGAIYRAVRQIFERAATGR